MNTLGKYLKLTQEELNNLVTDLRKVFDIVRLVDVSLQRTVIFDENGGRHVDKHRNCFEIWNKKDDAKTVFQPVHLLRKGNFPSLNL